MKTQQAFVKNRLEKVGSISNVFAFQHYILRLGGIIYLLRREGMNIVGHYEMKKGKVTRNYVYRLVK
jgi:hypothetical protein